VKPRDLTVIGGGAGGLVVASVAGQLGLRVTLIEKEERLGGDCLHHGCVPSKALIKSARVAALMRRADAFGLEPVEPRVELARVRDRVQAVVDRIQRHDDPERFRSYGCEVLFGAARFLDAHTVEVGGRTVRSRRFVIATGSAPVVPPVDGLAAAGCLTNRELFSLDTLPPRLLILGGGPIGLEMAQAFARLGSRVTVLERFPHVLPREDPEAADALADCLRGEGIAIHTGASACRVRREGERRVVTCDDGREFEAERILVAAGRRPNVEGLGLDAAGVGVGERGIVVDRRMRTTRRHIYACGDVCGPWPYTHMAEYQAGIVLSNAVFRFPKRADYRVVPRVTFTDPELARVGLSEQQAREQGLSPTVLRFDFADLDRALTEGETAGFARLVSHRGRIVGASILGLHAGELIHELVLAMQTRARLTDISAAIHAYPTLSQIHRRTVNTALAPRLFGPRTRRLVALINRLLP